MPLTPGTRIGHCEILGPLGAGGMGEVYRARDLQLDREVAVKVLPAFLSGNAQWLERFRREARTLAALNHPNIVGIHSIEETGTGPVLVMELVEGRPLSRELVAGGLPPARALELGATIAAALGAAHGRGIIHRDLKPDNIMLGDDGRLRLLDFGLAASISRSGRAAIEPDSPTVVVPADATRAGTVLGTAAYMSPEQAQGLPLDARSDVFTLGVVLYELAAGARPFTGADQVSLLAAILRATPPSCDALNPRTPARLAAIVQRCLEKDPAARFADAAEVHAALDSLRRWAREDGPAELARVVDQIQGLEEGPEAWQAFQLAREIERLEPEHPQLERLKGYHSLPLTFTSTPPGAEVLLRYYGDPESGWIPMGRTPLEAVAWPKGFTRVRLELGGRRAVEDVIWNIEFIGTAYDYVLPSPGELPDGMERVPAGKFELFMPGIDHLDPEPTAAFLMDRDPVTNAEYRAFVDAGGYREPGYWREPVVAQGRELEFAASRSLFVDATGQPGPAGWEAGRFAPGEERLPVTGVSWHEAAAYAAWAGKQLPTVFHWNRVAFTCASAQIVARANLAGRALKPVGSTHSVNRFGVRDLAGNVREWARNATGDGKRFLLGGGWNDPEYAFNDAWAQPPLDRSATNGFRCIRPLGPEPNEANLARTIDLPFRDFRAETPVPDAVFEFFLRQFRYDPLPLAARLEGDGTTSVGRMQTVTFAAAYGGERMTAYVFLPEGAGKRRQVVVLFPGSNALHTRVFNPFDLRRVDFLVRGGRVVVLPVLKGTYDRGGELHSDYPSETATYRDHVIAWARDLGRTIDYLETRDDVDASRIGYFGLSWGGAQGAIMPAIEKRFRACVLYVAGLSFQRALPEVDAVNYVTRVTQPTLMLNGELDFFFPVETSQKPMFELLGTPAEHKRRLTFPGGHSVPRAETIKQTLAWFDRYLGPVE